MRFSGAEIIKFSSVKDNVFLKMPISYVSEADILSCMQESFYKVR
ncbi:MAG: hypothetical protein Q4D53_05280 [Leptotrichiaceae bacterium]|nr:hypothetical protein [Leptotrichiaceae bacterium]